MSAVAENPGLERVGVGSLDENGSGQVSGVEGTVAVCGKGLAELKVAQAPALVGLDLSDCAGLVRLHLDDLPSLRWVRLPEHGVERIRLALEEEWCGLAISGRCGHLVIAGAALPGGPVEMPVCPNRMDAARPKGVSIGRAGERPAMAGLPLRLLIGGDGKGLQLDDLSGVVRLVIHGFEGDWLSLPSSAGLFELTVADAKWLTGIVGHFRTRLLRVEGCPALERIEGQGESIELERYGGSELSIQGEWKSLRLVDSDCRVLNLARVRRLALTNCPRLVDVRTDYGFDLFCQGQVGDLAGALARLAARPGALASLFGRPRGGLRVLHQILDQQLETFDDGPSDQNEMIMGLVEHCLDLADHPADRGPAWWLATRILGGQLEARPRQHGNLRLWLIGSHRGAARGLLASRTGTSGGFHAQLALYRRCREHRQARQFRREMARATRAMDIRQLAGYLCYLDGMGKRDEELAGWLRRQIDRLDDVNRRSHATNTPAPDWLEAVVAWCCRCQEPDLISRVVDIARASGQAGAMLTVGLNLVNVDQAQGRGLLAEALRQEGALSAKQRQSAIEGLLMAVRENVAILEASS